MRPDNSRYLIQAARDRRQAALSRARTALKDLDRGGQPVTFRAVAAAALFTEQDREFQLFNG